MAMANVGNDLPPPQTLQELSESLTSLLPLFSDSNKGQPQGADAVVEELKNRVLKAEAALKVKEEENLSLKEQIQQYETRWSDYEAKMKTMEETWQKQMISLLMSLAEAKKSLVADDRTNQQGLYDKSPNNHYFDSEDTTSQELQTPESTPAKQPRAPAAILPVNSDGMQTAVSHMVKEFEQKKKDFEDDARLLIEVKSGQALVTMNLDEELQKLKVRFTFWKKDYKVKLRETKAELQKIGNLEAVKTRRRLWIIRCNNKVLGQVERSIIFQLTNPLAPLYKTQKEREVASKRCLVPSCLVEWKDLLFPALLSFEIRI